MTCESPFICGEAIQILGLQLEGSGWFISMLLIALVLQVAANFVWLKNSQVTRELMQLKKDKRERLIGPSIIWTAVSTVIYIARVVLIGGNNLWIYLVVLAGNVIGVYWSQQEQDADHHLLADDISNMLSRLHNCKCSSEERAKIDKALKLLAKELSKREKPALHLTPYRDNSTPARIRV
jgi:hypothetical protein